MIITNDTPRKYVYDLIDNIAASYNPCFCWSTSKRWIKYFSNSHLECFVYRYLDNVEDESKLLQYKTRYLKRMYEINVAYVEECKIKHEEEEKKKQQKAKIKRKKGK